MYEKGTQLCLSICTKSLPTRLKFEILNFHLYVQMFVAAAAALSFTLFLSLYHIQGIALVVVQGLRPIHHALKLNQDDCFFLLISLKPCIFTVPVPIETQRIQYQLNWVAALMCLTYIFRKILHSFGFCYYYYYYEREWQHQ